MARLLIDLPCVVDSSNVTNMYGGHNKNLGSGWIRGRTRVADSSLKRSDQQVPLLHVAGHFSGPTINVLFGASADAGRWM